MEKFEIKEEFEVEVKRFYLPIVVKRECPECQQKIEHDQGDRYLMYPTVNKNEPLQFYCEDREIEFEVDGVLKISFETGEQVRKI